MTAIRRIILMYEAIEATEPDISTERLLQMTADACDCEVSDVCEALFKTRNQTSS